MLLINYRLHSLLVALFDFKKVKLATNVTSFHGWSLAFAAWGLGPLSRAYRILFKQCTEPVILPSVPSQVVKQRLLNFVRSLSTGICILLIEATNAETNSTSTTFIDAQLDEYSCTSVPSIWVVGDVTDRMNLTPVAFRC
ncbi:glutathione reductase, chloroplastic [Tanacetum coccineum]